VQLSLETDGFAHRKWGGTRSGASPAGRRLCRLPVRSARRGSTAYQAGDDLVYNEPAGGDAYAVTMQLVNW
jgi:hypothetical protein